MKLDCIWQKPPAKLSLVSGEIHLWRAWLHPAAQVIAQMAGWLAPDELDKAARFHFERDRQRYQVGRGLLRFILGAYLSFRPSRVQLVYNFFGKPGLLSSGPKNETVFFNVAHTADWALYAITLGEDIGVDVEQLHPVFAMDQIATRFFSRQERSVLLALPAAQRQTAFFEVWTRKEAFLKALGSGLAHSLNGFSVSVAPDQSARLEEIGGNTQAAATWSIYTLSPADGYTAAIAIQGAGHSFKFWDVSFEVKDLTGFENQSGLD
jgi:4'-phosphopantetheinyl transferase